MRHAHAVGLHRVTLPVVKVAHIGVVEVRDLLLARHRPRAAPRLRVLLASAGKQDWSGGFARARWREGEGGPSRIAREARRASKRTNVGCVRPREAARRRRPREIARQCPGAGTGKSRCQGYPDNGARGGARDRVVREHAGTRHAPLRSEIQEFLGRAEELVSGRVRSARASFWCVLARARLGVNLRAQSFPCPPASNYVGGVFSVPQLLRSAWFQIRIPIDFHRSVFGRGSEFPGGAPVSPRVSSLQYGTLTLLVYLGAGDLVFQGAPSVGQPPWAAQRSEPGLVWQLRLHGRAGCPKLSRCVLLRLVVDTRECSTPSWRRMKNRDFPVRRSTDAPATHD